MTQKDRVMRSLIEIGTITAMDAVYDFGCTRLAARIGELRNEGNDIGDVYCSIKNRFDEPTSFKIYYLNGHCVGHHGKLASDMAAERKIRLEMKNGKANNVRHTAPVEPDNEGCDLPTPSKQCRTSVGHQGTLGL